ncbi:hypothetical protein OCS_01448 [Ophiocordyceps sinensis CO18]|uniref:Transcription factor, FAR1-related protein n=1 Tax=Ophiocordyceps sinensis (strain Co18 / CGMCC 3.14243) TaxID=911162 RepID=T5AM47_OPHSC|nr:hypothetical protein OCS_01448 [Ophiocordyceps sinensis CO18]
MSLLFLRPTSLFLTSFVPAPDEPLPNEPLPDEPALAPAYGREIPSLPPSPTFRTLDELYEFLQGWHRDNGAAIVKKSSNRKRAFNGQESPTHVVFACDRGPRRATASTGLRRTSTVKIDCPVKIVASTSEKADFLWTFRVEIGQHNHGQSIDPSAHEIHRRRTVPQQQLERTLSKHKALPARELGSIIRDQTPGQTYFRQRDIYNDRQKLRFKTLGGKTATQAFIGLLQQNNIKHRVKYAEDDENKID